MVDKKRETDQARCHKKEKLIVSREGSKNGKKEKQCNIKLINIQGLTRGKLIEIEGLLKNEGDIICLTETHQKIDGMIVNEKIGKLTAMRDTADKKGGGLMILHKHSKNIELEILESKSKDILDVAGRIYTINWSDII